MLTLPTSVAKDKFSLKPENSQAE